MALAGSSVVHASSKASTPAVIARLIETIAAAKPRVILVDILFADADTSSPAGLARRLGADFVFATVAILFAGSSPERNPARTASTTPVTASRNTRGAR